MLAHGNSRDGDQRIPSQPRQPLWVCWSLFRFTEICAASNTSRPAAKSIAVCLLKLRLILAFFAEIRARLRSAHFHLQKVSLRFTRGTFKPALMAVMSELTIMPDGTFRMRIPISSPIVTRTPRRWPRIHRLPRHKIQETKKPMTPRKIIIRGANPSMGGILRYRFNNYLIRDDFLNDAHALATVYISAQRFYFKGVCRFRLCQWGEPEGNAFFNEMPRVFANFWRDSRF